MKRRDSLKALAIGGLSAGVLLDACKSPDAEKAALAKGAGKEPAYDRMAEQQQYDALLQKETFFTPAEMAVITVLVDIIIPADEVSGSATEAGVPAFIEFMAKDKPEYQVPLRGGIRWLDLQSHKQFEKAFVDSEAAQQIELIDAIAYPLKAKPDMQQGVTFFNLMRDLTASGFYTTAMGWKDIEYMGNKPNQWNGVPADVLATYNLAYTEKDLAECINYDS